MYSPYVEGLGEDELDFPDSSFDSTETKLNEALKACLGRPSRYDQVVLQVVLGGREHHLALTHH